MDQQPHYDVFISHNNADKPAVERFARRLRGDARASSVSTSSCGGEWEMGVAVIPEMLGRWII